MNTIGRILMSLLLLVLLAAVPTGCAGTDHSQRDERSNHDVTIGGRHGVVIEKSGGGTAVDIGGPHGVVVGNPRD
ncbi:MAG: hypothetical protein NTV86_03825 [Planctomycetota bacterium]|nr:hypothetical protein [Planctomycetota bacterium]